MAADGFTNAGTHDSLSLPNLRTKGWTQDDGKEAGLRAEDRYNFLQRVSSALQYLAYNHGESYYELNEPTTNFVRHLLFLF